MTFNGDAPNPLTGPSIFDDPEFRRQRFFDVLGGIGQGLLRASVSPYANDWGSLAGAALGGAAQGIGGSEDRYMRRALTNMQVMKTKQEMENDKAWRSMFGGGGESPSTATTDRGTWSGAPTATAGSAAPWSPTPQAKELVDYLAAKPGFNPMLAATVVGNFQQESGLNPTAVHDNGTGFGLGGWRLDRRAALQNYAKLRGGDVNDPKLQADFFADELKTRPEWQAFSQAQDPQAAATALMTYFRPAGWTPDNPTAGHGFQNRLQYAQALTGTPQVAQGDGSGSPVQLAQYAPPQAPRPQTMQDVVNSMPPGVRQMVGAMGRKEGMQFVLKYADPGSEAVLDTQSGQVVFIPKTMVGRDPRYQPVEGEKLNIDRRRIQLDAANKPVTETGVVNEPYIEAQRRIQSAQGTDPGSKITVELAQDAIKRNSDLQKEGMQAQSSINRLGALNSLLDQVTTGKFKGTTTEIKAIAKGAGLDLEAMGIKDDVAPAQAIVALSNLMALENRNPAGGAGMPGAMSDADRAYLQQASVSITKDPAGNKILIAIKKGDLQRQVDIAKYAREYIKSPDFKTNPAGLDDYVAEKIAGKDYYDRNVLPQMSVAPPGTIQGQGEQPKVRRYNPATGNIE